MLNAVLNHVFNPYTRTLKSSNSTLAVAVLYVYKLHTAGH